MKGMPIGLIVGLLGLAGCSENEKTAATTSEYFARGLPSAGAAASPAAGGEAMPARPGMMGGMGGMAVFTDGTSTTTAYRSPAPSSDKAAVVGQAAAPAPKALPRKIIYNADIDLVVDDFARAERAIAGLIKDSGGYLAESDLSGMTGTQRTGRWRVRVPVEGFDSFLAAVGRVGDLQRKQINSQDVTDQFYDLEVRIKNKKVEESRLVKHLEDSTGKLSDILDVERELSRVRGEIEQMQGQLNVLANLTALTTVTITVREVRDYVPAASPTFATRIARRFQQSMDQLREFLGNLLLDLVSIVPWLPVWAVVVGFLWLIYRVFRARISTRRAPTPAAGG